MRQNTDQYWEFLFNPSINLVIKGSYQHSRDAVNVKGCLKNQGGRAFIFFTH